MKFIKQESIRLVLDEARIFDVVSASETLKKQGTHYFCLSPFSGETGTPSFCVNTIKNKFVDYSAGFGGSAVSFLMKRHNIPFHEAIIKAAEICGIMIDYEEQSEDALRLYNEFETYKSILRDADVQYQKQYSKLSDDHWAKKMIADRGYSQETLETFMIGYAPNERSFLATGLINKGLYSEAIEIGIIKSKDGSSYDFLRDRLIFPIHDENGIVIGFGGRRSNDDAVKDYAKYLNSPSSKIYHKEKVLYGLFQAKKSIVKKDKAILVEGYTDVISLHNSGVENVIGSCGTALTKEHAKLISRYTKNVIIFRDGDAAGHKAIMRDIDILVSQGLVVKVVVCAEGEDPDSLARQTNIELFIDKNWKDAIQYKASILKKEATNPELPHLIETSKRNYEEKVNKLKDELHPDEAFENSNAADKKFMKMHNDEIFKKIKNLDAELNSTLKDLPRYSPQLLSENIEKISFTLFNIPSKIVQDQYVKMVAKEFDIKPKQIQDIIVELDKKASDEKKKKNNESFDKESQQLRLPKGADKTKYLEDRFCEIGNSYWFDADNGFFKGTNHKLIPLFHVEGTENLRLCEVINEKGVKRLIDFESKDLINFTKFQERLFDKGDFFWEGGVQTRHFKLVMKKLSSNFFTAKQIKILGHQKEGFLAFADGIYHDNMLNSVNRYGIVHIENDENAEMSEYNSHIQDYYLPAFSEIYKHSADDDDPYENDRHFVFKKAPISLEVWMNQVVKVFGDKGKFGVAWCLANNFRDIFLKHYMQYPLMAGIGQKDSGKTGLGRSLQAFFFYDLQPLELNISTLPGMSRRLMRVKNATVFFDEMRDDLEEDKYQLMKGTFNGLGREKGKGADTIKTSTDKVNCALYYAGQYVVTRDDGALPTRSITLLFQNKEYTQEEREEYQKLMNWNKQGITSFIVDVVRHRKHFEANIMRAYAECTKELKEALNGRDFQNRIFECYVPILASTKILKEFFNFPFEYDDFKQLCAEGVIENSELISDSDGLSKFWSIIEFLTKPFDLNQPNKTIIKEEYDYQIERSPEIKIMVSKTEERRIPNTNGDSILYVYFSSLYQHYQKEVSTRKGEDVIGMTTIRNYLKSRKYFIGSFKGKRMGNQVNSGYALNYTMMKSLNILNIDIAIKQTSIENELFKSKPGIITNPSAIDESQTELDIPSTDSY